MNETLRLTMHWNDWLSLFGQFLLLSLLSVGGANSTSSEMYRSLVDQRRWLTGAQFNASIAIAQAAPGPNILFVALIGWNIGWNAGGVRAGLLGALLTMVGILLPSMTLTYVAARWVHRNRELPAARAFKQGMVPIVIALLCSTGWTLATRQHHAQGDWPLWLVAAAAAALSWGTRVHLLSLLAVGAVLGWLGLV